MNKTCCENELEIMVADTPVQRDFFAEPCNRLQEASSINYGKENKMIATNSKNEHFVCVQDVCENYPGEIRERNTAPVESVHPLKKLLRDLWINIRLFFETDKWDSIVTLKVGDTHRMLNMDDIESRWRNPNE